MEQDKLTMEEWHRKQAVQNFNSTWDLIDKTDRTREDDTKMIHLAHASRFHWGEVGKPINLATGEWQISRVYSLVKMGDAALYHAENCVELTEKNNLSNFNLAFAYEALARAYMVIGNKDLMNRNLELAKAAGEKVEKEDDKKYVLSEINTISL